VFRVFPRHLILVSCFAHFHVHPRTTRISGFAPEPKQAEPSVRRLDKAKIDRFSLPHPCFFFFFLILEVNVQQVI